MRGDDEGKEGLVVAEHFADGLLNEQMEDFAGMSLSRSHSKTVSDEYEISTFHVGASRVRVCARARVYVCVCVCVCVCV